MCVKKKGAVAEHTEKIPTSALPVDNGRCGVAVPLCWCARAWFVISLRGPLAPPLGPQLPAHVSDECQTSTYLADRERGMTSDCHAVRAVGEKLMISECTIATLTTKRYYIH